MKPLFPLLLLCCIVTADFKANAQEVFAPVGAEWWYYNNYFGSGTTYEVLFQNRVTKDTIVMGQDCRMIMQTAYARTHFPGAIHIDTVSLRELYLYDNTDTVFIFNENFNRFTPLYIFNAHEGDTICLPVIPAILDNSSKYATHPVSGDTSFCFVIDSIHSITYDTTPLRTFYNHYITDKGTEWSYNVPVYNWSTYFYLDALAGAYAEKIGGLKGGLLPVAIGTGVERPSSFAKLDNRSTTFRCYSDTIIYISLTDPCDYLEAIVSIGAP